jgi:3-deoxy-manno-octulosonate cytidylyltransferase (CMP-KDO synthetase)
MLQHVYERASQAQGLNELIIATDDQRIVSAAEKFGAAAVMTSSAHQSGTERTSEAAENIDCDIVINIQGDEPLLNPQWIDLLIDALQDDSIPMATLRRRESGKAGFLDKNNVKLVIDNRGRALYFSRSPIPYNSPSDYWLHIGLYGFQKNFLSTFTRLRPSRLEKTEGLEQLRVLKNGYLIQTIEINDSGLSVDVPQDIIKVEQKLTKQVIQDG